MSDGVQQRDVQSEMERRSFGFSKAMVRGGCDVLSRFSMAGHLE